MGPNAHGKARVELGIATLRSGERDNVEDERSMKSGAVRRRHLPALGSMPWLVVSIMVVSLVACTDSGEGAGLRETLPDETTGRSENGRDNDRAGRGRKDYCRLPQSWAQKLYRGWNTGKSGDYDLITVPHSPNYVGSSLNASHSGPYSFLQRVPLVFYGPGSIRRSGDVSLAREVTIADIAPTTAQLLDFSFPLRSARPILRIIEPDAVVPKVVVTIVIDGGGRNVFERWPNAWPNIARLMRDGSNVLGATVGSSPSITPATHTNLSTGTFPSQHGVTAIKVRHSDGRITSAFTEGDRRPEFMDASVSLRSSTLAEMWDQAQGNAAKIAAVIPGTYNLGMVGRGAERPGGDKDIVVSLDKGEGRWVTNEAFYALPQYVNSEIAGPEQDLDAVDGWDGERDEKWRGHAFGSIQSTPAFAYWTGRVVQGLIERERFGQDDITDLMYVNLKSPDSAGHVYNMIAPEQRDTIRAVDDTIGQLVQSLDAGIGDEGYVVIITADHGQTPLDAGGWAINQAELVADVHREFEDRIGDKRIIATTSAALLFTNAEVMRSHGVRPEEVSAILSSYTIGDNVPDGDAVPDDFSERVNEHIFRAVIPGRRMEAMARCTGITGP